MSYAFLIQTAISLLLVTLLILVTLWARIPKPTPPLDQTSVLAMLADEYPQLQIDQVWIGPDGASALAAAGDQALTLSRLGDGYVSRSMPWAGLDAAQRHGARVAFHLPDPAAPNLHISWPPSMAWPPQRP